MRQLPNESPLTFISRLQSHEAKMHASIQKQHLTVEQKTHKFKLQTSQTKHTPNNKQCSFCKRMGHTSNECRQRQQTPQNSYSNNFFETTISKLPTKLSAQQRPYVPPQQNQNNQNRPPVITPNPNFGTSRPPAIQPNPNFKPNQNKKNITFKPAF
ncbi:hypothetical protein NQ318_019754 [Aromia moschata]|uniref:CCHC-type domain-containing protein n=1 Tax=Aromia moschata TaxID=1265417 RepID=A0AAV8XB80_9CUCU|nr:hypothetical protein NQ318_019754 [Aromia moschata]